MKTQEVVSPPPEECIKRNMKIIVVATIVASASAFAPASTSKPAFG
jgi:hypothetical protein